MTFWKEANVDTRELIRSKPLVVFGRLSPGLLALMVASIGIACRPEAPPATSRSPEAEWAEVERMHPEFANAYQTQQIALIGALAQQEAIRRKDKHLLLSGSLCDRLRRMGIYISVDFARNGCREPEVTQRPVDFGDCWKGFMKCEMADQPGDCSRIFDRCMAGG